MKRLMILMAVLLTVNVMMAQKKDRTDAFMYNRNGEYVKAMQSIEKCVNHQQFSGMKTKDQAQAWLYRAMIYLNIHQDPELAATASDALEKAYESLTNCVNVDPSFAKDNQQDVYPRIAAIRNMYYQEGADNYNNAKFDLAAAAFKKSYDISLLSQPDTACLNYAANASLKSQNYEQALTYFTEMKDNLHVDNVDIYKNLAATYNGLGNQEKAFEMINQGLEKFPGDASMIIEKVNVYLKQGKGQEAISDLIKLNELDPNNASILFILGTIYGDESSEIFDSSKAIDYYTRALQVNPDYYDATYNLGALYITMSNKLKTQANELPLDKVKEYNDLVKQAEDVLREGLPYIRKAYESQPGEDIKAVLKSIYVQLKMMEEAKALDAQ